MMSEPKRLHPIAAVANFLQSLKELLLPVFVLIIFGGEGGFFQFITSGIVILLLLLSGIITWLRFTYRIEEGELRIESGVFVRKKRYIPFERIQSLDTSEGILQRPFNLVKMKVETAGSSGKGDAEAVLTAINKEEASLIQQALLHSKGQASDADDDRDLSSEPKEDIVYKISPGELLLLSSTSGGAGVVISAVVAFILQLDEVLPYERIFDQFEHFIKNGILFISIVIFIIFFIAWLIALIGSLFKYADFTVKKVDNDLIITRGLLEKRQFTIPFNRIQAVKITENLLRQPFGFASVYVESAGGSLQNASSSSVLLLPITKKSRIADILKPYLTDYAFEPILTPAPRRSCVRYLFRGFLTSILPMVLPLLFFRPWGYFALLLLPFSLFLSYLKYKDAGWGIHGQQLTLRYRGLLKNTVFMKKNRIQKLSMEQSYFQERADLATADAAVMSGFGGSGGTVADLEKRDVQQVYEWYSYTEKAEDRL